MCSLSSLIHSVSAATAMYDMLKLFSIGRTHMVVLVQPDEEQLEEILDEVAPDRCVAAGVWVN